MADPTDRFESATPSPVHDHERELWKEGVTMALYVAICVLAALTAASDDTLDHAGIVAIVWGSTLGLALAHWFAFQVSARLVGSGKMHRRDAEGALAQLLGAAAVAALVTLPVLVVEPSNAFGVARLVLATFVAGVGYLVARNGGASRRRSGLYAASVLLLALVVVVIKNALLGH